MISADKYRDSNLCGCPPSHHTSDCGVYDPHEEDNIPNYSIDDETGELIELHTEPLSAPFKLCHSSCVQYCAGYDSCPYTGESENDDSDSDVTVLMSPSVTTSLGTQDTRKPWEQWFTRNCTHALQPYELSDGTIIYGSAWTDRADRDHEPDLAVYLDRSWDPDTIAFNLPWQDYGLPYLSQDQVITIARAALATARSGAEVEIACMGGHGRTGSMLAIIDLLTQPEGQANGELAISSVKLNYCESGIETIEQRWYVRAIAAKLNGQPAPRKPKPPRVTTTTNLPANSTICLGATCKTTIYNHGMYKNDYCSTCQPDVPTTASGRKTCYKHNSYIKSCENCRSSNGNFPKAKKYRPLRATTTEQPTPTTTAVTEISCPKCGIEDLALDDSERSIKGHFNISKVNVACSHCGYIDYLWNFLPEDQPTLDERLS